MHVERGHTSSHALNIRIQYPINYNKWGVWATPSGMSKQCYIDSGILQDKIVPFHTGNSGANGGPQYLQYKSASGKLVLLSELFTKEVRKGEIAISDLPEWESLLPPLDRGFTFAVGDKLMRTSVKTVYHLVFMFPDSKEEIFEAYDNKYDPIREKITAIIKRPGGKKGSQDQKKKLSKTVQSVQRK